MSGNISQVSSSISTALAAITAADAPSMPSVLSSPQLQSAINNVMRYLGNGAPAASATSSCRPGEGGSSCNGSVSGLAAEEHKQALRGLQNNYGYFPKDKNGYITKESLQQVMNDKNAPPDARNAAAYFLNPSHQNAMNALDTSRQKYQDGVTNYDGEISYEDIVSELTHPDKTPISPKDIGDQLPDPDKTPFSPKDIGDRLPDPDKMPFSPKNIGDQLPDPDKIPFFPKNIGDQLPDADKTPLIPKNIGHQLPDPDSITPSGRAAGTREAVAPAAETTVATLPTNSELADLHHDAVATNVGRQQ